MKTNSFRMLPLLFTFSWILLLVTANASENQFAVLHNFKGRPAEYPASGLTLGPDGKLYGTTGAQNTTCPGDCGTVFEFAKTSAGWKYQVIHNFRGPQSDGELPFSQPIFDAAGDLYGTTFSGGSSTCIIQHVDCGTVFKLARTAKGGWAEKVLYRFTGGADGAFPIGNIVLDAAGSIYGTTLGGGSFAGSECSLFGCGTVFKVSRGATGWTETVLYTFTGGSDGWRPNSVAEDKNGNLFGVAQFGGTVNSACSSGCGTVFELSPVSGGWTHTTVYSFTGGSDGAGPFSKLIFDSMGNVYGTASGGGLVVCGGFSCGTIFELSPDGGGWTFSAIFLFSGSDGEYPQGILLDAAGNIFGSADGGVPNCPDTGCGVLFKLVPDSGTWTETVLFEFNGTSDGEFPNPLLMNAGNLFGTAIGGGTSNRGTIFEFKP